MSHIDENPDSVHLFVALDRKKDNPLNSGKMAIRQIIRNYDDDLSIIQAKCNLNQGMSFRLYRTVNSRSLSKAFKLFQHKLIDIPDPKRIESLWKSCLLSSNASNERKLLVDIDSDCLDEPYNRLIDLGVRIHESVKTPRGYHIVTDPFDTRNFQYDNVEIKKDALIFVKMIPVNTI